MVVSQPYWVPLSVSGSPRVQQITHTKFASRRNPKTAANDTLDLSSCLYFSATLQDYSLAEINVETNRQQPGIDFRPDFFAQFIREFRSIPVVRCQPLGSDITIDRGICLDGIFNECIIMLYIVDFGPIRLDRLYIVIIDIVHGVPSGKKVEGGESLLAPYLLPLYQQRSRTKL